MNSKFIFKSVLLFFFVSFFGSMSAQNRSKAYEQYVNDHKKLAIYHMGKYKIPASIKLAQGLLETNAGRSRLAVQGNNHFGIKCHGDWTGETIYADDDAKNECFRKYPTVEASYEDHSAFLLKYNRYAFLFNLELTDYKEWARGLQKAGYATSKSYANSLIKLVDDYELYLYDNKNYVERQGKENIPVVPAVIYDIYKTPGGLLYVEAKANDNFTAIASSLGFKVKDLVKYNDVPDLNYPLNKGDVVYLEKKKKKAELPHFSHIVVPGESMHSISQYYSIRLKDLYKMNKIKGDYIPEDGDVIKLR